MLECKTHLRAWLIGLVMILLVGCADAGYYPPATPTPEPTMIPPSGAPISVKNASAVQCLANSIRGPVYDLAWSNNQRLLAVASFQGAYVYDAKTLKEIRFIQDPVMIGMNSVAISPDNQLLAGASREDSRVRLYYLLNGEMVHTLVGHEDEVKSLAFSPDGKTLATGSADNTIRLWNVLDGKPIRTLQGHNRDVLSVAFSPDGKTLASGGWDNSVRLWRVSDGALLHTLQGHTKWVRSVTFSPDGRSLASASWDKTVRLWNVDTGALVRTLSGSTNEVEKVTFSPDGSLLAAAGILDKTVWLLRVNDGSLVRKFGNYNDEVQSARFSPDGSILAVGTADGRIDFWGIPLTARALNGS